MRYIDVPVSLSYQTYLALMMSARSLQTRFSYACLITRTQEEFIEEKSMVRKCERGFMGEKSRRIVFDWTATWPRLDKMNLTWSS